MIAAQCSRSLSDEISLGVAKGVVTLFLSLECMNLSVPGVVFKALGVAPRFLTCFCFPCYHGEKMITKSILENNLICNVTNKITGKNKVLSGLVMVIVEIRNYSRVW